MKQGENFIMKKLNENNIIENKNICSNCGEIGHNYFKCMNPILSAGIIAFRRDRGKIEYLIIRRKDTLAYAYFIRGKYVLHNKFFLQHLIDVMTESEKKNILERDFNELWDELWGENILYISEKKEQLNISKNKLNELKTGCNKKDKNISFNLKELVESSKTNWIEPEWGFPKGKKEYFKETELQCALREFEEETGYSNNKLNIIKNIQPFIEYFIGSNYKTYKHIYFLAEYHPLYSNDIKKSFQKTEVSAIQWVTLEEAIEKFRLYDIDRIEIIKRVDKILRNYILYT